jgi:hypothetical protein
MMDDELQVLINDDLQVEPGVGQEGPLDVQSVASNPINV